MARMIPSVMSPEVKSTAEKRIFNWFKNDPSTEDWIVLHSLGIANHNTVIHGETDFFVLVPYRGLFALEVKGGRVKRENGRWSFKDKYDNVTTKEGGPFDQAWDGVFSIIEDIRKKLDNSHKYLGDVFFGIGVMFPDVEYDTVGCDEEQWQVFDSNDGDRVGDYILRLFSGAANRWKKVYNNEVPTERLPTEKDVEYIASLLRGDFDKALAVSAQIRYSEEELIRLTNEQYKCLDQIEDNKRCLISGGAGTGKTLIAIEEAKRASSMGMKVALVCFNKNLGDWFERYFDDAPASVRPFYVGTFHKYMIRTAKKAGIKLHFPENEYEENGFYETDIPYYACRALRETREKFDKIIIDEAQDLLTKEYLEVMDLLLHGGIARGKWTMLGDFSSQAIYSDNKSGEQLIELLENQTAFIRFKLTINCRNTKAICEEITTVTGFKAPSEIWSRVEGMPVEYHVYSDADEQKAKFTHLIDTLLENHISTKKVTILSPMKRDNSVVSLIDKYEIKDYKTYSNNRLTFCTIQAFKGLENTVIILTDIDSLNDKKLMYVALSRARSGLYILESEAARQQYLKIQMRRIEDGQEA